MKSYINSIISCFIIIGTLMTSTLGIINVSNNLNVTNTANITWVRVLGTTDSTDTGSGALIVAGGFAAIKSANIGGDVTIYSTSGSVDENTGSLVTWGGAAIGENLNVVGSTTIYNSDESIDSETGALIVNGGVGIAQDLNIGGQLQIEKGGTVQFNAPASGASIMTFPTNNGTNNQFLKTDGSGNLSWDTVSGGDVSFKTINVTNSIGSTDTSSGALTVLGGIGVGENINLGGYLKLIGTGNAKFNAPPSGSCILTLPINNGSSGNLLQTDGTGNLSWGSGTGGDITPNTVSVTSTLNSTSTGTGALKVAGGVGIGANLFVGGVSTFSNMVIGKGAITITDTTNASNTLSGALIVNGGACVANDFYVGNTMDITGDLHIGGNTFPNDPGLVGQVLTADGFNNAVWAYPTIQGITSSIGKIEITNTADSTSTSSGALVVYGGLGVAKNGYFGGVININNSTDSTSTGTGCLVINGGIGIANTAFIGGDLSVDGIVVFNETTEASDSLTGSVTVAGGASVEKSLYVGGSVYPVQLSAGINHSTFQALSISTQVQVLMDTRTWDNSPNNAMTATANTITIITTGKYLVSFNTSVTATSGAKTVFVNKNSTTYNANTLLQQCVMTGDSLVGGFSVSQIFSLAANDILRVYISNGSGTPNIGVSPAELTALTVLLVSV